MKPRSMDLAALVAGYANAGAAGGIVVHGLAIDSRDVRAGDAFVALEGARQHGITFAPMALARGAVAILAERPEVAAASAPAVLHQEIELRKREPAGGPTVWVDALGEKLGSIASRFFDDPSAAMTVIGVTGTNGKTSTVHLLAQALHRAGHAVATIGTLGAGLAGEVVAGARTTPDAIAVQGLLATFRDRGATHVAMEVSSHALDQGRVNAVAFDLAVFTNLTRDHLDYHGTMQAYGAAKERLFAWPGLDAAIINVGDPFSRALAMRSRANLAVIRYGRLAGASVVPHGAAPAPYLKALVATAETIAPPTGPLGAGTSEEIGQILSWLAGPGARLVALDGEWCSPVDGAGRFRQWLDAAEEGREAARPFEDRRGLRPVHRPARSAL